MDRGRGAAQPVKRLLVLALLAAGCPATHLVPCAPLAATRCAGTEAQVCSSRGWARVADCREVADLSGGTWACTLVDTVAACRRQ